MSDFQTLPVSRRAASQVGVEVAVFDLSLKAGQGNTLARAPSLRASATWTPSVNRS